MRKARYRLSPIRYHRAARCAEAAGPWRSALVTSIDTSAEPCSRGTFGSGFGRKASCAMSETLGLAVLVYVHLLSLTLWFGGLFGYVAIVWPAILTEADGALPRDLLVRIAVRTAPWLYLGMSIAVLSFLGIWALGRVPTAAVWMAGYGVLLAALVANNVYGTLVAWPRIMFSPDRVARREWFWFRVRMTVSLVVGLGLHGVAVIAT
jgi:hypothetical protein